MALSTILHIDMDAFFASVEQRDNPKLRNKPVAVVGSGKRTVLVSPSYQARAFGVKTAMTRLQAKALCPDIIFVTANTAKYVQACNQAMNIIYQFSPDVEVYSIDEFFVDITHTMHLFGTPDHIAGEIRGKVNSSMGLSCSIGIAHNKLLAKLASERCKPAGICALKKEELPAILDDLKPDELWGIGPKTKEALEALSIYNLGQLRRSNISILKKKFGVNGLKLHLMARGIDHSPVTPMGDEEECKSMGHSMTFKEDTSDPVKLNGYLLKLCDKVGRRLRREALCAKSIKLIIRYKSFTAFSKQKTLFSPSDDTKCLYHNALSILRSLHLKEPVRLLGLSAGKLSLTGGDNFLFEEARRKYKLNRLLDHLNERFGDSAVSFASLLGPGKHQAVISPAWRPYGSRHY